MMAVNVTNAICYVDGFNLYHSIDALRDPTLKWLDLRALAHSFLSIGDELRGVVYFTAIADWSAEKARRHRSYIAALRARDVEIVLSRFQKVSKVCARWDRACPFREEKETDVALASRVLVDALTGVASKQVIVTADTDHVPMLRHVRSARPNAQLVLAVPPGRISRARALCLHATNYREIQPGRLRACRLPQHVSNSHGVRVASCPPEYMHRASPTRSAPVADEMSAEAIDTG
jgi:hypothetical protein